MTKRAHLEAHLSGEELATHYHEAPDVVGMRRQVPSGWPLLGDILALGLASLGEALIESQNPSMFTLFCYLVGISIFVLSGSYLPPVGEDTPGVLLERSSERLGEGQEGGPGGHHTQRVPGAAPANENRNAGHPLGLAWFAVERPEQ